jgi:hypothetical protein
MIKRRQLLYAMAGIAAALPRLSLADRLSTASADAIRIGATWRGPREDSQHCAGLLEFNVAAGAIRVLWSHPLPGRAHGLVTSADGSLLVMAVRPGYWMRRFAQDGRLEQSLDLPAGSRRHFTGHAIASRDSLHLLTGETDASDDSGWISLRDSHTLQSVAEWRTHGVEPHDLKLDASGALLVANGGICRAPGDRKRELDRMNSSLTRIDTGTGALLGQWRLQDPRLSLRHLAWSQRADGRPLLGIGIQAEHDSPTKRREAPVLATWDGASLVVPTYAAAAEGYAGDICAAPHGGFIVSSHRVGSALWWHPTEPAKLTLIAKLTEAYALSSDAQSNANGVLISSARGAALWHPARAAALLPWPAAMVMENHWALMLDQTRSDLQ